MQGLLVPLAVTRIRAGRALAEPRCRPVISQERGPVCVKSRALTSAQDPVADPVSQRDFASDFTKVAIL